MKIDWYTFKQMSVSKNRGQNLQVKSYAKIWIIENWLNGLIEL